MKKLLLFLLIAFCVSAHAQGPVYNFYSSNQVNDTLQETTIQINNEEFTEQNTYRLFAFYERHSTHILTPRVYLDSVPQTTGSQNGLMVRSATGEIKTFSGDLLEGTTSSDTLSGTALQTSYVITHGLSYTPSSVFVQAKTPDATEKCYISAITGTTFTITFLSVPTLGSDNIVFDWTAYK